MLLLSPLEQFQILAIIPIKIAGFDLSITNALLVNILALLCFSGTPYLISSNKNCYNQASFFFISNRRSYALSKINPLVRSSLPVVLQTKEMVEIASSTPPSILVGIASISLIVLMMRYRPDSFAEIRTMRQFLEMSPERFQGDGSVEHVSTLLNKLATLPPLFPEVIPPEIREEYSNVAQQVLQNITQLDRSNYDCFEVFFNSQHEFAALKNLMRELESIPGSVLFNQNTATNVSEVTLSPVMNLFAEHLLALNLGFNSTPEVVFLLKVFVVTTGSFPIPV